MKHKIHFIGIGGIALSGIASIYKQKGNAVSGSDEEESEITQELKQKGIKVFIGHKKSNLWGQVGDRCAPVPELVVYSEAVPAENVELKEAKRLKIQCLSGAQALADLSRNYFTIAVSGMHGKSTTASMIAKILVKANFDPTFVIGTKPGWRLGKSPASAKATAGKKYLVIEADDYQAKFLNYYPDILVLTNIEEEHMDWFKNLQHILKVFGQYTKQVKKCIVANKDNKNVVNILKELSSLSSRSLAPLKSIFYSLKDAEARELKTILKVPGNHNVSNALAALNVARLLGIDNKITLKALSEYKGVWRRFEESDLKIENPSAVSSGPNCCKLKIISDYAHHPTEINATLQALQEKYGSPSTSLRANSLGVKRIWVVFQPHQYQRTFYLFDDFVKTFQQAKNKFGIEKIIITDIYSVKGRETQAIKQKTSSQKLVQAINRDFVEYIEQSKIGNYIKKNASPNMVLAILGAGDIYKLADELSNK